MKPILLAVLLPLALAVPLAAAPIRKAALARHIAVLASDGYEGRKPGTPGETKAITYIAGAYRDAGLAPGAADGGWYQPVALVERVPETATLRLATHVVADVVATGRDAAVRVTGAPIVYVGYGIVGSGRDDLAGVDVTGAVVLLRSGAPDGFARPPRAAERARTLLARGAVAILTVAPPAADWDRVRTGALRGSVTLAPTRRAAVQGMISAAAFRAAVPGGEALLAAADAGGFVPSRLPGTATIDVRTTIRPFTSWNVVGRRAGTGAIGEAVLFTGHWDHLGLCRPAGAPDRICNGAVDNASGIASLIETARALGTGARPVRDEVFVATTAEEMGLLGMEAWVDAPTVPLNRIVAAINVDTVAIAPRGLPVAIVGRGLTRLDPLIDATARRLGRRVDTDLDANAFIDRQDGAVLTRRGVPAVMIGGSFSDINKLEAFLTSAYHGPGDDVARGLVLGGAAEDADLTVAVARRLVDPVAWPTATAAPTGTPAASDL